MKLDADKNIRAIEKKLRIAAAEIASHHLRDLILQQNRAQFCFEFEDMVVDCTRQPINKNVFDLLIKLAEYHKIPEKISNMFSGKKINLSEGRNVCHTHLRNYSRRNQKEFLKLSNFVEKIRNSSDFKAVVTLGTGGSELGPSMVVKALAGFHDGPMIHFVGNADPQSLYDVLKLCDPKSTLFVVVSKSFKTSETIANANLVRRWLDENGIRANDVMVAVTANAETASSWGVKKNQIFSFDSGVGGRYSLWSAVGLPAMIAVGNDVFCALLDGAASMDRHFLNTPLEKNLPVIMGLLRIWHRNYLGKMSYGVIPYDQRLLLFPEWVRQLEMESNGKSVDCHGKVVSTLTGPLIWGGVGTSAQHSFFQWLHQSTDIVPIDILIALKSATLPKKSIFQENYRNLVINALAQSEALAVGSINEDEPHLNFHGNRPSILICWNKTTPYALGRVLSLYEHITVTSGFLWGINSFDQWGVELGKEMARDFLTEPKKFSVSPSASFFLNMLDRKNND